MDEPTQDDRLRIVDPFRGGAGRFAFLPRSVRVTHSSSATPRDTILVGVRLLIEARVR